MQGASVIILSRDAAFAHSLQRGLEVEGFRVQIFPSLEGLAPSEDAQALVVDLPSLGEEDLAGHWEKVRERGVVLALLLPQQLPFLDSPLPWDDFALRGAGPDEVAARLRLAMKMRGIVTPNLLRRGELVIDLTSYRVYLGGKPVQLTYREFELLRFLASHPGKVFTREELVSKVWGYEFFGGTRTVDVHVRRLRAKLESPQRTFIETVRNVGYRFQA